MMIRVEVNGATIVEGDLLHLLFQQAYAHGLQFHPPEGAEVRMVAWVHNSGTIGETITMRYDDEA